MSTVSGSGTTVRDLHSVKLAVPESLDQVGVGSQGDSWNGRQCPVMCEVGRGRLSNGTSLCTHG